MDTLAVCDTEPIAIEGLRSLLETAEGLRVVAAETTLAEALDAVRDIRPSLLLVDKGFGIHAVMDWLRALRATESQAAVIIWGNTVSEAEALRFLQAGASGVVRKTAPLDMLLHCLRTVSSGSSWMEDYMLQEIDRPGRLARSALTARELQVMELVERGMKNKDIAASLGIRTGTVKIHLKHIFEKTGIHGRYGLALSGLKEKGLLAAPVTEPV
ncbi:MAG TPA: response regulator transcription factor [Bryobacteraceae bacterium]|nr:response regulator transcription factor [Bryobacteraceae bacterium]